MKRPTCEWQKFSEDRCHNPATHTVTFVHNDRSVLSCENHAQDWHHRGSGWWVARLEGFCGSWENAIEDTLKDNQRIGEARRAGELAKAWQYQVERVKATGGVR